MNATRRKHTHTTYAYRQASVNMHLQTHKQNVALSNSKLRCSFVPNSLTSSSPKRLQAEAEKRLLPGPAGPKSTHQKQSRAPQRKSRRLRSSHTAGGGRVPRLHHPVRLQATPPTYPPLMAPCNGQPGRDQAAETQQAAGWAMKAELHLQTLGAPQRSSWAASESGHTRGARKARSR